MLEPFPFWKLQELSSGDTLRSNCQLFLPKMSKTNGQISIKFAGDIYGPWRMNSNMLGEPFWPSMSKAAISSCAQEICSESAKIYEANFCTPENKKTSHHVPTKRWTLLIVWPHGLACSDTLIFNPAVKTANILFCCSFCSRVTLKLFFLFLWYLFHGLRLYQRFCYYFSC